MRSPINARSNCPMAAMTWKISSPAGVEVSTSSLIETKATRHRRRWSRVATSCLTERAARSNRWTMTASNFPERRRPRAGGTRAGSPSRPTPHRSTWPRGSTLAEPDAAGSRRTGLQGPGFLCSLWRTRPRSSNARRTPRGGYRRTPGNDCPGGEGGTTGQESSARGHLGCAPADTSSQGNR